MRVLFVTSRFPFPPLKGDQSIPYHRLRLLSEDHEIHLLSLASPPPDARAMDEVKRYCRTVSVVPLPAWRSWMNVLAYGLLSRLPLQVLYFRSGAFESELARICAGERIELIHCFMLRLAPYVWSRGEHTLMELIDSMQLNMQRRQAVERGLGRWVIGAELRRVCAYEQSVACRFPRLVVVAQKDAALLPPERTEVIPLGVDTLTFKPRAHATGQTAVFSGNMGYAPNVTAALWFAQFAFPELRRLVPNARLIIAGDRPAKEVRELAAIAGIEVTGRVDSLAAVLQGADVAIAPMQSGSGMQFKILEAMACGLPVVCTSLARGDISGDAGCGLITAESPQEFAAAIADLMRDEIRLHAISAKARAFIEQNYTWTRGANRVRELYRELSNVPLSGTA